MVCVHRCDKLFIHSLLQLDLLLHRWNASVWGNGHDHSPYRDVHVFFTGFGDLLLLHSERDDFGGHIAVGNERDRAVCAHQFWDFDYIHVYRC